MHHVRWLHWWSLCCCHFLGMRWLMLILVLFGLVPRDFSPSVVAFPASKSCLCSRTGWVFSVILFKVPSLLHGILFYFLSFHFCFHESYVVHVGCSLFVTLTIYLAVLPGELPRSKAYIVNKADWSRSF